MTLEKVKNCKIVLHDIDDKIVQNTAQLEVIYTQSRVVESSFAPRRYRLKYKQLVEW